MGLGAWAWGSRPGEAWGTRRGEAGIVRRAWGGRCGSASTGYANGMNLLALGLLAVAPPGPRFVDWTDAVGLGPDVISGTVARVAFADLDADGWPDAVIDRHRVFMNVPHPYSPIGRRFVEVTRADGRRFSGLAAPADNTATVFADLDNDGKLDAFVTEYVDLNRDGWKDHGRRTGWHPGNGDGTFRPRELLPTPFSTTISIAAGDVNRDGILDLFLGNAYVEYGEGYEGYRNDLLWSVAPRRWLRWPLPEDEPSPFDPVRDAGGRPTYGTLILTAPAGRGSLLLEMSYGRRWNRAWAQTGEREWTDLAPALGLAGDDVRHGRYPEWLKERAKEDARFDREDEMPYRANGNTFDAAVGDVDNDGDLDLLLSEITHGWAGESSDRTRVLVNVPAAAAPGFAFRPSERIDLDRPHADPRKWNQGDLFCALADVDHDGRTDCIVSSGDYPDDQRLRIFLATPEGGVRDATASLGLDHDGAQQISLADVDGDGDLDILVGQTFNRYPAERRAGREPHVRLFINEATRGRGAVTLRLKGDGEFVNRDALGAVVRARFPDGTRTARQLVGIGGHAGKQDDFIIHIGLGDHDHLAEVAVEWPDAAGTVQKLGDVPAGRYVLEFGGELRASP